MDDLDHSVLIAEQDWDCFCIESEECFVQQAKLAALDESGFSDTDDDKPSAHVPSLSSPEQVCEKDSTEEQTQDQTGESKIKHTSENSEFNEYPNAEPEAHNAQQTFSAKVNEQEATCEGKDNNLAEKLRGNDENQENGENKSSQSTTNPVSEMFSADIKNENSTDGIETVTKVTDCSPVAEKEKERWFVTVNDSHVRLRVKSPTSVQKKRRKKKLSKNLCQKSGVMEKSCSFHKTKPEKEIIERKTMKDTVSSDLPNIQNMIHIQDVKCISSTGPSGDEEESCAISAKKETMTEIPETKLERNPVDTLNPLLTTKQVQQMIFQDPSSSLPEYWDHESASCGKSILDINSECQHTADNKIHFNDTGAESSKFILGASEHTPTPSNSEREKSDEQEPLGQSFNREESSQTSQETQSSSFNTSGPSPPIFAISSFWDEMEKLTINDILQLRIANNRSVLTENISPEEIRPVDAHLLESGEVESKDESLEDGLVDDAADSDYFTHLDDSKPDRSSCEFSTYSDFDDEFIQLLHASANPSPEPLESKDQTQGFFECPYVVDSEATWRSESKEIVKVFPESDPLLYMYSETETEMPDIFLTNDNTNMNNFLLDHCSMTRSTPSPVLSVSDILEDQCLLSFFDILNSDTELKQYQAWIPNRNNSLSFSQNECLAETYDDFFSDFEVGNVFFPSVRGSAKSEKALVPIYSSSRSVLKDLEFPEVEDVVQSDSEDERSPTRGMRSASPFETSNMYFMTGHRSTWRNLSLRHTKLFMGRNWCWMATTCGFPKTGNKVYDYEMRTTSITPSTFPVLHLENQALGQMKKHQIHAGATVTDADKDHFFFSIKQADMCLVCIAFASWVLKSSNQQSSDMWKAALLANVSAISAIQYLRQYVKDG